MHIICRSLKNNFESVKLLLSNISFTLTAIARTETWLKNASQDLYSINGYRNLGLSKQEAELVFKLTRCLIIKFD